MVNFATFLIHCKFIQYRDVNLYLKNQSQVIKLLLVKYLNSSVSSKKEDIMEDTNYTRYIQEATNEEYEEHDKKFAK